MLCSALIVAAYLYQSAYQAKYRADLLQNNLNSGINILLTSTDSAYRMERAVRLFPEDDLDSVSLRRSAWGAIDIGIVKAFAQQDTIYKVFSIANALDSAKWGALYLIDEDRPLSLSGQTTIRGDAYIPKAGVKTAYVDNQSYTGDKQLIQGKQHDSEKKLPPLTPKRLQFIRQLCQQAPEHNSTWLKNRSIDRSFRYPTTTINLGKRVTTLQNISLSGNIVIHSDTTLIIDSSALLDQVIVFAKAILVKSGFHGNGQLFAKDSISVERDCLFSYPSYLGLLRDTAAIIGFPEKISLGENTRFTGFIFTYEKAQNPLKPLIILSKNSKVSGQIYSQGILSIKAGTDMTGNIMTSRFLYQNDMTAYENYLINTTIDAGALSRYYLTSDLSPISGQQKKILQWLEVK
ncbi:hypothetical protein [Mucilaginibacter lappiensis]|uniref:Cytoskeletal protein CcmA (Bactofilin family) n=1 Tax=Mucilaginibacter lappiensis TaxID=354630 RepID=A0A841JCM8_9SPHI|nr:hypothetical protein [Mucilaginibacter lappiensis]MBB6126358.1 cytoskeletal protein CcmA (bactofilin family) [Mucilaginibacter lappiensis]